MEMHKRRRKKVLDLLKDLACLQCDNSLQQEYLRINFYIHRLRWPQAIIIVTTIFLEIKRIEFFCGLGIAVLENRTTLNIGEFRKHNLQTNVYHNKRRVTVHVTWMDKRKSQHVPRVRAYHMDFPLAKRIHYGIRNGHRTRLLYLMI